MCCTKNDHTRRAVAALLVLCSTELDHVLRRGMGNVDLSQNRIAVVGDAEQKRQVSQSLRGLNPKHPLTEYRP
jgi:hypothetical protein